jgi:NAD(P)-dependent dehydrogenase (short-subunit alcohol dehydrogenase family)
MTGFEQSVPRNGAAFKLGGQLAVVTGAAEGIGAAIARALVAEGTDLAAVDIKPVDLAALSAGKVSPEQRLKAYVCDVTSSEQVAATCAALLADLGAVAILVNNAGGSGTEPCDDIATMADKDWDYVLSLSLSSSMRFIRGLVSSMRSRRYGRIVNISSTLKDGVFGPVGTMRGRIPYVTAKMALIGLTLQLAKDLGPEGITVNAVAPGLTLPGPNAKITLRYNALPPDDKRRLTGNIPAGRPASGEDVANAVRFLCLPESGYLSGQTVCVDGGA